MSGLLETLPSLRAADVPWVTREQMREVDRLMVEELGIAIVQMMENAGLQLADLARRRAGGLEGRRIVVLAGRGNNGGGGLAAARRLRVWGAHVEVALGAARAEYRDVPALQLGILDRMGVSCRPFDGALPEHDLLIDAVIGYSLSGAPRGVARELIAAANESPAPAISLDVPSGLDVDTGGASGEAVRAAATLTLALPKPGLLAPGARKYVGELYLADISVPPSVYVQLGLRAPTPFAHGPLARLVTE